MALLPMEDDALMASLRPMMDDALMALSPMEDGPRRSR